MIDDTNHSIQKLQIGLEPLVQYLYSVFVAVKYRALFAFYFAFVFI